MGKEKKVIVAMSGGVDSSVAAALLKKRGNDVRGVFMRLWKETRKLTDKDTEITEGDPSVALPPEAKLAKGGRAGAEQRGKSEDAERCARAVAEKLNIPFRVIDLRKEFKKRVIDCFLREFESGRTPNPCVVCNQQIKFGLLLDKAMETGADYVATGHYARVKREFRISNFEFRNKSKIQNPYNYGVIAESEASGLKSKNLYKLIVAKDKSKDQSYFLYNLTQEKLRKILFPLGDYKKSEIYKLADKWQLPYKKGESVDICFVGKGGHRSFLRKYLKTKPGKIIDTSGKILGQHQGLWFYTIGQRAEVGGPGPFYVVSLDLKKNNVVVTNNFRTPMLFKQNLIAKKVNWISGRKPDLPLKCLARIRYGHATVLCAVSSIKYKASNNKNYEVIFETPQRAVTPGQSVVLYKRNRVLGGGVIES